MALEKKVTELSQGRRDFIEMCLVMYTAKELSEQHMEEVLSRYQKMGYNMLDYWNRYNIAKFREELKE